LIGGLGHQWSTRHNAQLWEFLSDCQLTSPISRYLVCTASVGVGDWLNEC
jgi:hypothetical protein